jgi:hypothetical protein
VNIPSYYIEGLLTQGTAASARTYLGITGGGVGIPEAPINGSLYGRVNANWAVVPAPSTGIPEAPVDGQAYVRQNAAWILASSVLVAINQVAAWSLKVVSNGGAAPSTATANALIAFVESLIASGVWSKMVAVNCFVPDSLTASLTPLLPGTGSNPWVNHNFALGDLSVIGLAGDGSSKYLDTGLPPSLMTYASMGVTLYAAVNPAGGSGTDWGAYDTAYNHASVLQIDRVSDRNCVWDSPFTGRMNTVNTNFTGYISFNRTGVAVNDVYAASSSLSHAKLMATNTVNVSASNPPCNFKNFVFAGNNNGGVGVGDYSHRTLSFAAFHVGLSITESASLYNSVQALRTALGGGFV